MEFKFEELDFKGALEEVKEKVAELSVIRHFLFEEKWSLPLMDDEKTPYQLSVKQFLDLQLDNTGIEFDRLQSVRGHLIRLAFWEVKEEPKCAS